jgi:hypothetical protein
MKAHTLLNELQQTINLAIQKAEAYKKINVKELNYKTHADSWSVLECLEHLNLYGDYYIPAIEKAIMASAEKTGDYEYKSSWLGNYFANSMLPKDGVVKNKMKTFKDKNPQLSNLDINTIERFIKQLKSFEQLLAMAKKSDINRIKIPVTVSRFIKLNIGDVFRFNINHIQRHLFQADNVLKVVPSAEHVG